MKQTLVILLALLQLAAPLVHAHVADDWPGSGLHVPGLERYGAADVLSDAQALHQDTRHACRIFSVDSGIRNDASDAVQDRQPFKSFLLFESESPAASLRLNRLVNFSPHRYSLPVNDFLTPQSPRAPPVSF